LGCSLFTVVLIVLATTIIFNYQLMDFSSFNPVLYLVILIISGGVVLLANGLHYAIEESTIINFRLRLSLLTLATLALPVYCFFTFDVWHHHGFQFLGADYMVTDNQYKGLVALFGVAIAFRFYRYSDYEDLVFLMLIGVYLLRFLLGVNAAEHVYLWVFFAFMLYYGAFIILHWTKVWSERAFMGVLCIIGSYLLVYFADWVRASGYVMTYMGFILMVTLWVRYLWNLEYKRRQRCKTCGGWGKLGIKEKSYFWWAVGYKESSSSVPCKQCEGKGWIYRYPDLFYIKK